METIIAILAAASIPSAIFAAYVRRMEKKIDEKDKAREEHEFLIIKSINASMALGEATAHAIKDGKCNGEMSAALEYAQKVKHEQKDFLNRQAVHAIT